MLHNFSKLFIESIKDNVIYLNLFLRDLFIFQIKIIKRIMIIKAFLDRHLMF